MTDNLTSTSTEVLEHEATTLAAQIAAVTCRFLLVLGELDNRETWRNWGCRSMAHWVSWRCSLGRSAAFEHVRIAGALRSLPVTVAAFERGELSFSKVRVLTRIATTENEAELLDLARTATAAQLERIVRATVVAMQDPAERHELRALSFGVDTEGFGTTFARAPIDQQAIIEQAVAKAVPSIESSAEDSKSPIAQRRLDALTLICEHFLATGDAPTTRSAETRNNAVIHVDVDPDGVVSGVTDTGVPVPPETCKRLLCDATVQGMLGDLGHPVGCGRQTRTINRKMRRWLDKRSGRKCEFIGCTSTLFLQGHHVWEWARGGPTEAWNLVNLCWHHHHLVHEGGYRLVHDGLGGVTCYRPDGSELTNPIPTIDTAPLELDLAKEAIVPRWSGERFDVDWLVSTLLYGKHGLLVSASTSD
jgi:hypothetical protein